MRFLFPNSLLQSRQPDEMFVDQVVAFEAAGFATSLISLERVEMGQARVFTPDLDSSETVVYRGWMLNAQEYQRFEESIAKSGAVPLTDLATYLSCHHLPRWYPLLQDLTPETHIFPAEVDLPHALESLGWERYFIKDYVKSVKTAQGSLIDSPEKARLLVAEMLQYRGAIEGGFCVRRVEAFIPGSEKRYFIIQGIAYAAETNWPVPAIVHEVAARIRSPFFSVDIVERQDGVLRVVEVGDGQVSDIVGWSAARLAAIWKSADPYTH